MDYISRISRGCPNEYKDGEIINKSYTCGCSKLNVYDWLDNVPQSTKRTDIVEVRFKNTRKDFYINVNQLPVKTGDLVVVEAQPGHDVGTVSLTGELVFEEMRKYNKSYKDDELKKIYRKARSTDIEKWQQSIYQEKETMLKSRKIAADLNLDMKIGDVEYQGDKTKAIFYYIADERVDFRQLIKNLAEEFRIRVEMKQIGVRQEAGRIGGIGPCGRELCCATWMSNFCSVSTNAAKHQTLSLNPQKLAGQCSKLKCCLNYELDVYLDAQKDFPNPGISIETKEGRYTHQKTDVFKRLIWYANNSDQSTSMVMLTVEQANEAIDKNKKGQVIEKLISTRMAIVEDELEYTNESGSESIDRFTKKKDGRHKGKKRKKGRNKNKNRNRGNAEKSK